MFGFDEQPTDDGDADRLRLWAIYYVVICCSLSTQVVSILGLALVTAKSCYRCCHRRQQAHRVQEPIALIVPCYLPNEAEIIIETLEHLLTQLELVDALDIYLVYNTPHDMPVEEAELHALAAAQQTEGRRLFVQRVHGSMSKAENLNHIIPQITANFIAIYDADHHPDPQSLSLAIACLEDRGVDCVQGSTYIREGTCLPRTMVNAEFFVTYFVLLPMMEAIAGNGLFGGANAVWRSSSLQQLRFNEKMLTEDIDCFARAVLDHNFSFAFLPECRSGELRFQQTASPSGRRGRDGPWVGTRSPFDMERHSSVQICHCAGG